MASQTFHNLEQKKKQSIIDAAILEFSSTIPDHINIQNIIKQAKIPRGSFYQYFKNKEDLYIYIFKYIGQKKQAFFSKEQLFNQKTFIDFITSMYISSYQFFIEYPLLYKAGINMMAFKYYEQFDFIKESQKQSETFFIELIKKDQKNGLIKSSIHPMTLTQLILGFLDSKRINTYVENKVSIKEFKQLLNNFLSIIMKGIENHV